MENKKIFKTGDRVRIINKDGTNTKVGDTATVVGDYNGTIWEYSIRMDVPNTRYHSCAGRTEVDRGQFANKENLELIKDGNEFKLIITSKGDKTKAKLIRGKTVVKEVEVNRYHEDTYSEYAAVDAVVSKIFDKKKNDNDHKEEKKPSYFNGKAVCVSGITGLLTKGKIYLFTEGRCKNNCGFDIEFPPYTVEMMNYSTTFIPIVE